jgi:hypothetical protein
VVSLVSRRQSGAPDTIAVVSRTEYGGRTSLVAASRDLWRWDFVARAFADRRERASPFSRALLDMVRGLLAANLGDSFFAYPNRLPLHEAEPITLTIVSPAGLKASSNAQARFRLVTAALDTIVDSVLALHSGAASGTPIVLPRRPRGLYTFSCELLGDLSRYRFADSLRVEEDNSELQAMGQNTTLLGQIARPLEPTDSALHALVALPAASRSRQTTVQTLHVRQTWCLLALILGLFALEWMLRRRLLLD